MAATPAPNPELSENGYGGVEPQLLIKSLPLPADNFLATLLVTSAA